MNIDGNLELPRFFIGNNARSSGREPGQEDFLSMLLVQLQYQDPLDVMSQSEFTAQLAQFSQLEQLQRINETIGSSISGNALLTNSLNNTLATTLIDRTVLANGNRVMLEEGEDPRLAFELSDEAVSVTVEIYDEDGDLVRTMEYDNMDEGRHVVTWNGEDDAGRDLSSGEYTFKVRAADGAGSTVGATTYVQGTVDAVRYVNGQAILIVDGLEVAFSDVVEILGTDSLTEDNNG
jgi:flagellar basal-body rod modification protein FlgD